MSATNSDVIGALAEHGWNITERITRSHHSIQAKMSAVHFYLNVCGFVTAKGVDDCMSTLPILVESVEKAIQKSFQHSGVALGQSAKFGCGIKDRLQQEFQVRMLISCMCLRIV